MTKEKLMRCPRCGSIFRKLDRCPICKNIELEEIVE